MLDEQLVECQILLLGFVLVQEPLRLGQPNLLWVDPEVLPGVQSRLRLQVLRDLVRISL